MRAHCSLFTTPFGELIPLGMARLSVTDVVGDVHVQAEFAVDVTRTGGVAVVSTCAAVWVEMVVSVLPFGVLLGSF